MRWTPGKGDWAFLVAVVAVVLFVSLLPTPRERNPMIPVNEGHRRLIAETQCSHCHAVRGSRPLADRHPKRQDCFKCHRQAEAP
jgi:hypothetical protein